MAWKCKSVSFQSSSNVRQTLYFMQLNGQCNFNYFLLSIVDSRFIIKVHVTMDRDLVQKIPVSILCIISLRNIFLTYIPRNIHTSTLSCFVNCMLCH